MFFAHKTQIYTAYEAIKRFIFRKKYKNQKGIVFQVETGEGKSCIVCLIAAAHELMKKTVHVTSSNIKLSTRDFEESFLFFKLLDIKSAVLVHSNELPLPVKLKLQHDIKEENQNDSQNKNDSKSQASEQNKNDSINKEQNKNDSMNKEENKDNSINKEENKNNSMDKCSCFTNILKMMKLMG